MEDTIRIDLINEQLKPHKKTYYDVQHITNWFMKIHTTKHEQTLFMEWAVEYLIKNLKISRKLAEVEVSWFILQWGLTLYSEKEKEEVRR